MHAQRWLVAAVVAVGGVSLLGAVGDRQEPPLAGQDDLSELTDYTVVIPRASYQSIVISPRDGGADPRFARAAPFVIRTRDAGGRVSDFPIFVRIGEAEVITFPGGWAPPTAAELMAPASVSFAAWGVSAGAVGTASPGSGQLIRFEPLERDTRRESRDRERARQFEEFLRDVERLSK